MGSGKTTIGRILAEDLNFPFYDLDDLISASEGYSIKEIFELHGESYFRSLETKYLKRLLHNIDEVVACGGGIVEKEESVKLLTHNFIVVYLKVPFSICYERIKGDTSRPKALTTKEELKKLYKKRSALYEKFYQVVVRLEDESPYEAAQKVKEEIFKSC